MSPDPQKPQNPQKSQKADPRRAADTRSGSSRKKKPQREVLLALQGLRVGYGDPVCAPVDLEIGVGEAVCLVGANGAGKSTVLRAVAGLLEPLGGKVLLRGRAIDERSAEFRRQVACVFDEDAWFAELSVAEHLELVARGHGVRDIEAVVDAELEAQKLTGAADQLPTSLSSGQKRRLLMAAALVRPRALLLLDEPEQRLDPTGRETLAARLAAERDAGTSMLLATHDVVLLRHLADRAVVIDDHPDGASCRVVDAEEAARIVSDPVQ